MKNDKYLTYEEAVNKYAYDPDTGVISNRATGHVYRDRDKEGYLRLTVKGHNIYAHRVVFMMHHGFYPEHTVDHIDRVPQNLRANNLREATIQCQNRNQGLNRQNTSGVKGVSYQTKGRRWIAKIKVNREWNYLGCFTDFDEAVAHRLAAEQCLDWDGCDTTSPALLHLSYLILL